MFHSTLLVYQNVFTISLYFTIKIKIKHYQLLFMNQFHIISPSLLCVYPICPPPGVRSKPPWTSTVGSSSGSSSSPPEDPIKYQQKILGIEQHGSVKRHGKTNGFPRTMIYKRRFSIVMFICWRVIRHVKHLESQQPFNRLCRVLASLVKQAAKKKGRLMRSNEITSLSNQGHHKSRPTAFATPFARHTAAPGLELEVMLYICVLGSEAWTFKQWSA